MSRNLHLVMQAKGGVGKTFIASMMLQFLRERDPNIMAYDVDPTNNTLSCFKSLDVNYLNLLENKRNVDVNDFDRLFEYVQTSNSDAVVDSGSSSFVPLYTFFTKDRADEIFTQVGYNVILHVPIIGGESRNECLVKLESMINEIPNAYFVVWLNEYFGEVFNPKSITPGEPHYFEDLDVFKNNKDRIKAVITINKEPEDGNGKLFKQIISNFWTFEDFFSKAKGGLVSRDGGEFVSFSAMQLFRARCVKENLWQAMQPLLSLEELKKKNPNGFIQPHNAVDHEQEALLAKVTAEEIASIDEDDEA